MRRITLLLLWVASAALFANVASAASTATPRVDRREARQRARIAQGVQSGQLTAGEAARLRAGQRRVHRIEHRAKADGVVTPRERARLERGQDRQSRAIHRLKHNARTR